MPCYSDCLAIDEGSRYNGGKALEKRVRIDTVTKLDGTRRDSETKTHIHSEEEAEEKG